jgi:hypothetical protein
MDIQLEPEFQRWAEEEEASYYREVDARARAILETEDLQIPTSELLERRGRRAGASDEKRAGP